MVLYIMIAYLGVKSKKMAEYHDFYKIKTIRIAIKFNPDADLAS